MDGKICAVYMEQIAPEKIGIAASKWVVWCQDLIVATDEVDATVVDGAPKAAQVLQSLIDMQKARGYRVFFSSKEM